MEFLLLDLGTLLSGAKLKQHVERKVGSTPPSELVRCRLVHHSRHTIQELSKVPWDMQRCR